MLHTYRPAGETKILFVVVRFIARSLLVNGTHRVPATLHHTYKFVPIEEQQLVRSRDSEIPPTRVIDCRWLSGGFGDRRGKTVRFGMQIAFGRVRRKTAPTILAVSYQRSAVSDGSWRGGCSIVVWYTYGVSFW